MDELTRRIIDRLQGGFPLSARPFAEAAALVETTEASLIARLDELLKERLLTRFGPLFQIERMGGAFSLAALAVPESEIEAVAERVNAHSEVAHNYLRTHRLNMWFVLATEKPAGIAQTIAAIEAETGLQVFNLPKIREYYVGLRFSLDAANPGQKFAADASPEVATPLSESERALVLATQGGLPLDPAPYAKLARDLGQSEAAVIEGLQGLAARGVIRRIGVVPNHFAIGFKANGMTVWDVDDALIDELGAAVGALPEVSHCYRRPRHRPDWPFNLFAMLHGRTRDEVEAKRSKIGALLGQAARASEILYSTRILKKTGLRIA